MPLLEIIAETLEDARNAAQGGADSLELITHLEVGGLTPSLEVVQKVRDAVMCRVYVMLRPHAHSFVYHHQDRDHILATLEAVKAIGVTGVVFGALTPENDLDLPLITQVAHAKGTLELTIHRALDHTRQPDMALQSLVGVAERILCSGGASNIVAGQHTMARWVRDYGTQFSFGCAGGVTMENIAHLAHATRAHEMHSGSAARLNRVVSVERVRMLKELVSTAT
jgi:copper homeostasis protein